MYSVQSLYYIVLQCVVYSRELIKKIVIQAEQQLVIFIIFIVFIIIINHRYGAGLFCGVIYKSVENTKKR